MIYCNHQNYKKRHGVEESSQEAESTYEMRVRHRGGQHGWILRGKEEKKCFSDFFPSEFSVFPEKLFWENFSYLFFDQSEFAYRVKKKEKEKENQA